MKKVLIVEDEAPIREFEAINLQRGGYTVVHACCGEEALELFSEDEDGFDIALLDVMMPGIDGMTVCKQLRQKSKKLGIIMLTAKSQEMDKVTGLMLGADDYITKPFSPSELMARVDTLYRRVELVKESEKNSGDTITLGEFTLNLLRRSLYKRGEEIELTQVEYLILECFFKSPNTTISRRDLLLAVWGKDYKGDDKVVDVNIRRLRVKVEDSSSDPVHLLTVWGMGYKWIEE